MWKYPGGLLQILRRPYEPLLPASPLKLKADRLFLLDPYEFPLLVYYPRYSDDVWFNEIFEPIHGFRKVS